MTDYNQILTDIQKDVVEMRSAQDINAKKHDALLDEKIAKLQSALDEKQAQIDAIALSSKAPRTESKAKDDATEAFVKMLRKGENALSEIETKALSVGNRANEDGGYTVPQALADMIIAKKFETNPLRAIAGALSTARDHLDILNEKGEFGAGWTDETTVRTETATAQIASREAKLFWMWAEPTVTRQLLLDSAFDIESFIASRVGEKMGRLEATAFMTGNGTTMPSGLLTAAGSTSDYQTIKRMVTAGSGVLTFDDLIATVYDIKAQYRTGASFLMNRTTLGAARSIKDSYGQYIWQPSQQVGQPSSILGYPVVEGEDLGAYAAGNEVAVFGNFKSGYAVVDHAGSGYVIRDEVTKKGFVKFHTANRVGGIVTDGEALRIIAIKA